MAQAPYVLNLENFETLCKARNFATRADFLAASGIPLRTFQRVAGDSGRDLSGVTISLFLDAFPGVSFEYLFTRTAADMKLAA